MVVALKIKTEVYPQQEQFIRATEPFVTMIGGRGSGKTRAGAYKARDYLLAHPGALGIITAPTYKMLKDATMRTCLEYWPKELIREVALTDMRVRLGNSEVLFRSTEDPDKLRGPTIGFFWMDEGAESSGEAFEILQGCLRQEKMAHQGWITSTPKGHNWLYQKFVAVPNEDYRLITCSSRLNPYLPVDFIKQLEESYREDWALQEIEGQFVIVSGQGVFDLGALKSILLECREPLKAEYGAKVWGLPIVGSDYIIGADVGMINDLCAAIVLSRRTGEIVATLHGSFLLDEYAQRLNDLGRYYNNALLAVEADPMEGVVIHKLKALAYPRLYKTKERYGWLTTGDSKLVMIMDLEEAIRKRQLVIYDKAIIDEMFLYARNKRGQFMASEGAHDDMVMALAIAWQIRGFAPGAPGQARSYLNWKK